MKKNLKFVIIFIVILVIGIGIWLYLQDKEMKKIDAEAVTLKEDLTVAFGEKVKASDFIENLNGTMVTDPEIDTEKLGNKEISFNFKNIKNKDRVRNFTVKVIDVTSPQILSGNEFSVKVGYEKKLEEVLLSGDDIDDNPEREILGEYDVNTAGDYNLTYVVTDSSGNQTQRKFVLHVKEPEKPNKNDKKEEEKKINFEDILTDYKTDKNKIGIDVSKWQEEINWEEVKNQGVEFAMIRMGYQTEYDGEYVVDPYFIQNIEGAKEVGLPVGLYFYSYAKNVEQAIAQANWVKENLKDYEIDLPIAFDWESWTSFNTAGMSFYTINKVANVFLDTLKDSGYDGMLYSSKAYLEDIWAPTKYDIWLAQYNTKVTYNGEYSIWQMTDKARIEGIDNDVDVDIMYLK